MAVGRGFHIATAYVDIVADYDSFRRSVREELPKRISGDSDRLGQQVGKKVSEGMRKRVVEDSDKTGRDAGGKLAQGMRQSMIRNSPLIAAAIAGGLAAGAPVMLAAATALFAGVGIAGQAQSLAVRSAWGETWQSIKADTFEASRVLQPVLVGLADRVREGFHRLAPVLGDTFEAAAPQVQVFADGVLGLASNALPGLQRAVERGMPVTRGLASLLESVGDGLTGFFDAMSEHSPAAGKAFEALGDILAELLPLLGNLLGTGAELASIVLPPLAKALGVVADVADALGPVLPAIVAGFTGMKIAQTAAGWVSGLGDTFTKLKSKVTGAITPANAALGTLGIVVGLTLSAFQESEAQVDSWAQAILEGGSAAQQATIEMQAHQDAVDSLSSGFLGFGQSLMGTAGFLSIYADDADEARQKSEDLLAAMDPVHRTQALLTQATNDLSAALQGEGKYVGDVAGAQENYERASREAEEAQSDLEMAIDGVTSAMIEQADQALAAIDSGFAYRKSLDDLEDAQADLNDAITEHGRNSEAAQRAQLDLEEQVYRTAQAYGQQQADLSGLAKDSAGYARIVQTEMLAKLYELRDAAGPQMRGAIQQQIDALEASGVSMQEVGRYADTATSRLQVLASQRPQPTAFLNSVPFFSTAAATQNRMNAINALRASPLAFLYANTSSAEQQLNYTARNRTSTVTQYVNQVLSGIPLFHAAGGKIGFDDGGPVRGPGGPTDDLIRATGPDPGIDYRLSNLEYVIRASSAMKYGDAKMDAVNRGIAQITVPTRGFADGGSPGSAGSGSGGGVRIERVEVNLHGTFDFSDPRAVRRVATMLREEIIKIEREYR